MEKREEKELDEISLRLHRDGVSPEASTDERERHLWHLLQSSEGSLTAATEDLQSLRTQQASEMREVENYVEHIRNMLEERESLTAEYERDNEQLRAELALMKHQQDSQCKEVVEMLEQEGLADISQSSASEQVAYLLVERVTLLERLEAAERKLDTQTLTGNLREVHLQEELDHIRHALEEELRQQKENMNEESSVQSPWRKFFGVRKATLRAQNLPAHSEELGKERTERQKLERDLEEASSRLAMAHEEIRHLTDELDIARKVQNLSVPDLQKTGEEVELLKQEVDKLKQCDMVELHKAKERNERLDGEICALRDRVRSLDTERRTLLKLVEQSKLHSVQGISETLEHNKIYSAQGVGNNVNADSSVAPDDETLHKRCRRESEDKDSRLRELERRLQKQQREHEELVERNEELEALLGEAQNAAKDEREHHECEIEGLQRKIKSIEEELSKRDIKKLEKKDEDLVRGTDSELSESIQERLKFLEGRLAEEKGWRKQLEVDLSVAKAALKKEKEVMQKDHEELKRLRVEVQSLEVECRQGKTLNKNLTQIKGEKGILEEKVAQLERAQTRLQDNLTLQTENSRAEEDLRDSRGQVVELKSMVDKLRTELTRLEKEHNTLRDELMEKRGQVMQLQRELSEKAHERLQTDGEKERLSLEVLHVRQQLQYTREQTPRASQEQMANHKPSAQDEGVCQLACVKSEMSKLHSTLEEERQLAGQHQLALQAQISEAQARAKAQDSLLKQKGEENKQLRQDLQRTQHLFTSAERELRYEREKNLDLKRHNALLDQEKIKLCAELKQAQAKVAQQEGSAAGQVAELERLQQRARDLELDMARSAQNRQTNRSLMEELNSERARVIAADKKVVDLQQQLKNALHQIRLEEARAGETSKLERDTRDMSDNLSALRARLQEDQLQRKLLEQKDEELQQQVRSLRAKEATMTRNNLEMSHRTQELETRLQVLESELNTAREEQRGGQKSCHRLEEQLLSSQHESERLQEELKLVVQQLDTHIRRHNEKQSQHKTKLRRAKQIFMKTVAQHEHRIQQLENDLALATSLSEKEKDWIRTMTEENDQLLLERRELLQRISEAEEMGNNGLRTATTIQQRVKFLEMENKELQEKTLTLANQIGILDRALRNLQSMCTVEEVKKMFPSGAHHDSLLRTSTPSPQPGLCDSWGILDAIRKVKVGESGVKSLEISSSVPVSQSTEIGYLNLTSPVAPNSRLEQEESLSATSDEA
ncbi:coiled-coil domain-containing protein 30 isoform X1 [Rhinichthys klamathensis goyatoka]|uniref:coiled-coil domain-containing protein 30 isoform X1 n=1 Tax=Rhinichthys klamathensis goyatoka TaxID=3034132 RepID=UPI0024B53083|nr:coiled-coil domain-containing protein 30 isoform X1 [Rhinichthys klamathensis goyatoka]XP_056097787.1 coiled-coil domain-containing protein 30 isoform X1 [Rhinichthys klamathensis goyatoka]XP_056097788.1 coiled-coil domain-containing protein 30 isoform X1 [Rhinichthys klamathensis goyatoka]XP_056097789.1 coiled-coil domain-containing protein 30 isoform X1 [Rhinichthys klamathensis goyatoka]